MGKPVIMGRKTWDSLPRRPLLGRINIVLTRDGSLRAARARWSARTSPRRCRSPASRPRRTAWSEVCVIGGAALFELALPKARRIYLTEVDAEVEGDVCFPPFDESGWIEVRREAHPAGEDDDYPFTFRVLERRR